MTPQELKDSIIQLALLGKVTEHVTEDGTGDEALKKAIKTVHSVRASYSNEDYTLDLPESWTWAKLSEITSDESLNDGNWVLSKNMAIDGPVKLIQLGSIGNCKYKDKGFKYLTEERFHELNGRQIYSGYLLVNRLIGDRMLACILPPIDGILMTAVDVCWIAPNDEIYDLQYLMYVLTSSDFQRKVKSLGRGTTRFRISKLNLIDIAFPFPPLAEQKRIVAKIEELLPLIDRYEAAWSRLEDFNKRFPEDMQKSILQMAIQGKLVEQCPEEGTGEELYKQIQAEKQELIKAGKIKKGKTLPEIAEDDIPFEIPESWAWAKLGEMAWFLDAGKSPNCQKVSVKGGEWGVITTTAIQRGFFDENKNKVLPESFKVNDSMQVKDGDILITRAGPTNRTGIACLVKNINRNLILSDKTLRINMTDKYVYKDFIVMVLNSPQIRQIIMGLMSGMDKQQVNISQDKYKTVFIPIPPLAEQKRIVDRLEELLSLCEKLKSEE
ncbi:MAG: restriction endonuclease subunit S [Eubacterium sp.]|nr:restriction endonuclease subunit S [Eubacterium sp.]